MPARLVGEPALHRQDNLLAFVRSHAVEISKREVLHPLRVYQPGEEALGGVRQGLAPLGLQRASGARGQPRPKARVGHGA